MPGKPPAGVPRPPSGEPGVDAPLDRGLDGHWAALSYIGAIFLWLLAPLVVYLAHRKKSPFTRSHAAQSFNLALTGTLFALSIGIVGALLALDSARASLVIMIPLLFALWIVLMIYLVRAASAASRGELYEIPAWICVPMLK